ncbi:MAG: glycerate kinase [Bacteroidales bacterium]|nr:glycerate kinase [Bacteroidales bacterium]
MKILIAPDSYKDCLTAQQVADYIKIGLLKANSGLQVKTIPLADGGEGTVDAIVKANNGSYVNSRVHDPLMREINARYGSSGDGKTAIIEMAAASGLELLKPDERNPWETTSYGTGELIKDALDRGFRRIIIGIGGSATNDGGAGMASALGIQFLNTSGKLIKPTGGGLSELASIDFSGLDKRIGDTEIIIASDVRNPLTGKEGASFTFGRQKGASECMIKKLDDNLKNLAEIIKRQKKIDIGYLPGAGAAGGLGAGLAAFLGACMQNGFEIVKTETGLEVQCQWADIVITGEGKTDGQTRFGKTPMGVAGTAKKFNKKVICISGALGNNYTELYSTGFDIILSIIDKPMQIDEALSQAPLLLENAGALVARMIGLTNSLN